MNVFVLGSGSSGNALLVESSGTRVLIEAGIGPKVVASRLAELGVELGPGDLHGIVPTHEHKDHFGQAEQLARAFGAPLFLHAGIAPRSTCSTRSTRSGEPVSVRPFDAGTALSIGTLAISTVHVPHDASQIAIRVDDGSNAFGVATDVGRVTSGLIGLLAGCDAALVEANHCSEMLAFSEYPESVKRRIGGGWGHLSNAQAAELAGRLVGSRLARLWLGHLSRSNNSPARALETVAARAKRMAVDVVSGDSPVRFAIESTKPYQLGLRF